MFDYRVTRNNPAGGCHLRLLRALSCEHQFTVFSVEFENPSPGRIEWVRIPAPMRPLAFLFVSFHLLAPVYYLLYRLRTRTRFDLVQMVESNLSFGDVCYPLLPHGLLEGALERGAVARIGGIFRRLDPTNSMR